MRQLQYIIIFIILTLSISCNSKYKYVEEQKFIGEWELKGRGSFIGMQIKIFEEDGNLKGKIIKLSDSKYVKMFAEEGDVWIKQIKRNSNFAFTITESKIAAELFAMYGNSTSNEFQAEFINDNKIGLAKGNSDPQKSSIFYERINIK
ncbi:MAG: hypothetical protein K8R54_09410 [Bacteroidales bacterium]|nr:hypothetical protein [Bacteroidales bacterium]